MHAVRYEPRCKYCEHQTTKSTKRGEVPACRKHILMPCDQYKDFSRQPGSDDEIGAENERWNNQAD